MKKISVIAPVTLTEESDAPSMAWRQGVNAHASARLRLMLKSFGRGFDRDSIEQFLIVCPDRDEQAIRELVAQEDAVSGITVANESEFFTACGRNSSELTSMSGWQKQQVIKLEFSKICETAFYLTMDSDIVQFREAGLLDLFPNGERALAGVETAGDYDRLYRAQFSVREREVKTRYYEASQRLLGYERPADRAGMFFSETPVVLHRSCVTEMLDHLESRHGKGIVEILGEQSDWTEYSLYFLFLEMTGWLDRFYVCGGANDVLCLEKSVWQPTGCYRSPRFYDRFHFVSSPLVREGPFLAIQSWIKTEEWLPVKFRGLDHFYQQLWIWLLTESAPPEDTGNDGDIESLSQAAFLRILEQVDPASALSRRSREVLNRSLVAGPFIPEATPRGEPKFLTIGMTTHNDYDGCYFTIQAIRLYHSEILDEVEFIVIDNDPAGPCAAPLKALENWVPNYRYIPHRSRNSTAVRDLVFREASGDFVLCIDCHVLFPPGCLAKLVDYCRRHPESDDLLQGPLISDAMEALGTHFEPRWAHGMYGQWGLDERGADADAEPFEIGMQGLGVFACRRAAWPGFNPRLAGFGGEEGYLHEKIRRAGGRNLCLPFLRWMHRFERPLGIPYRPSWADRIRNYLLIYDELGLNPAPVVEHFEEFLGKQPAGEMVRAAQKELAGPFHCFDAIYCINLDRQKDRWVEMQRRFHQLGIELAVRRFSAIETPFSHHIGCALSHRMIIEEAKRERLKTVLVFEDDALFTSDAAEVLRLALRELEGREWQLLYLGGYRSASRIQAIPGCENLVIPGWITCTHAIAYHHSAYDAILESVPDNAADVAIWNRKYEAIDKFYNVKFCDSAFLIWPVIATQSSILPAEQRAFEQ
jgi:hypothetical protein